MMHIHLLYVVLHTAGTMKTVGVRASFECKDLETVGPDSSHSAQQVKKVENAFFFYGDD